MADLPTEQEIVNDSGNPVPVSATSWPLPTGAATEVTLSAVNAKLPALVGGRIPVDGSGVTQPISAASLPLPSGAATSALQTAANASLTSIDSKLTSPLTVTGPLTDTQLRASAVPISAASLPLPAGAATALAEGSPTGGTAGTKSVLAGQIYNSTPPTLTNAQQVSLQSDVNGNLKVSIGAATVSVVPIGTLATYAATVVGLAAATSPTDIVLIKGSATKIVKIGRILISGYQTNASLQDVLIIKRSADNTGGTRAAMTAVSFDSSDGAATAQLFSYTANPSALGTSLGTVRAIEGTFPNKSGSTGNPVLLEISNPPQKPITLNNANEYLSINLNALSMPGSYLTITVEWTEQ